jgi:MFS family permease
MVMPPALRYPAFREYLGGSFLSNVGNMVQTWAIAWHVFDLTHSSLMVGLLGIARVVPLLLFSLLGGVVADQADRRKVILATQSSMMLLSIALFFISRHQESALWLVYAVVAFNAIARSFDGPARQAMQVNLVPFEHFPNAVSLNGVVWRLSEVVGPIIAGVMIAWPGTFGISGLSWCYLLNFFSFFGLLIAVLRMPAQPAAPDANRPKTVREVGQLIKDGLRFVNRTPVVRSAMWIDFWATLFSGAESLLPAFAGSVLKLGPQGYGILAASSGTGALLAATSLTWMKTIHHQGRTVVAMIFLYGLFTIAFGLSPNLWLAAISLAAVGAADMISTVLRQTIRQLATPDELRGRMNATSSLFHISGPQLGNFEAGAVASMAGERFSIVLGGALCMLVAAHWTRARELMTYTHTPAELQK